MYGARPMANVVFVAPYALEATGRFVQAVASQPDAQVALVSSDPLERFPEAARRHLAAHWRTDDCLDPASLAEAVWAVGSRLQPGGIDRLLAILENLQVPLAEVREKLGIPGMGVEAARNFRDKGADEGGAAPGPAFRAPATAQVGEPRRRAGVRRRRRVPDRGQAPGRDGRPRHVPDRRRRAARAVARRGPAPRRTAGAPRGVPGRRGALVRQRRRRRPPGVALDQPLPARRRSRCSRTRGSSGACCCRATSTAEYATSSRSPTRAIAALGLRTGLSHMEWFRRPDGSVAVSEVGARPPGAQFMTLMSWAHDIDMYDAWAGLAVHDRFEPPAAPVRGRRRLPARPRVGAVDHRGPRPRQISRGHPVAGRRGPAARAGPAAARRATRATATSWCATRTPTAVEAGPGRADHVDQDRERVERLMDVLMSRPRLPGRDAVLHPRPGRGRRAGDRRRRPAAGRPPRAWLGSRCRPTSRSRPGPTRTACSPTVLGALRGTNVDLRRVAVGADDAARRAAARGDRRSGHDRRADDSLPRQGADEGGARRGRHPHAAHRSATTTAAGCREAAERIGYPMIIKPIAGAGSPTPTASRTQAELEAAHRPAGSRRRGQRRGVHRRRGVHLRDHLRGRHASASTTSPGTGRGRSLAQADRVAQPAGDRVPRPRRPRAGRAAGHGRGGARRAWASPRLHPHGVVPQADGEVVFGEIGARPPGARLTDLHELHLRHRPVHAAGPRPCATAASASPSTGGATRR